MDKLHPLDSGFPATQKMAALDFKHGTPSTKEFVYVLDSLPTELAEVTPSCKYLKTQFRN